MPPDDTLASPEEIQRVLLQLTPSNTYHKKGQISIGVIFAGPLSRRNLEDLKMIKGTEGKGIGAEKWMARIHAISSNFQEGDIFSKVPAIAEFDERMHSDPRYIFDDTKVDAIAIVGALNIESVNSEQRRVWFGNDAKDREISSNDMLNNLAVLSMVAGKDVWVFRDKAIWQPAKIGPVGQFLPDQANNPVDASERNQRVCWYAGLDGANDFVAFLNAMLSRKLEGKGIIRSAPSKTTP
jgi:hypothetical protein